MFADPTDSSPPQNGPKRRLFVIVMSAAALHKVTSPAMIDGAWTGYALALGQFGDHLWRALGATWFVPARRALDQLVLTPPSPDALVPLALPRLPWRVMGQIATALILVVEIALALAAALMRRARGHTAFHILLISFIFLLGFVLSYAK